MKKLTSLFAAILMASTTLFGQTIINDVKYIDANGEEQTVNGVTVIHANYLPQYLSEGWYVVQCPEFLNVTTGGIECIGAVNLILADGAKLTATSTGFDKPGIRVFELASLTIYGQTNQSGQLIANGGENAAGIGGGSGTFCSNITINGGIIKANGGARASGIGGGYEGSASDIYVATTLQVKADGNNPPTTVIANDGGDLADKLAGKRCVTIKLAPLSVTYIDANGEEQTANDVTVITNSTAVLSNGWYVVKGEDVQTGSLVCDGEVHLILADGSKLTATASITYIPNDDPGIKVSGENNSLTIYGQTNQTGELIANGGDGGSAGIGGGNHESGSNITINGGTVTANGIGGGYEGYASDIYVTTKLQVKADNNNPPTTEIENEGGDISDKLNGKQYVTITTNPLPSIKIAVIAEIESARQGIQNTEINAQINDAINAINKALTITAVNDLKSEILSLISFVQTIKAEGKAEVLGEMATKTTGHAVKVTKGTKTVILYTPDQVTFEKVTEEE